MGRRPRRREPPASNHTHGPTEAVRDERVTEGVRPAGKKLRCERSGFGKAFKLEVLRESTDGFSDERLLGEGGSIRVLILKQARLQNGDMIAVKKFTSTILGINDTQFENEASHLMRLKQPNIVQLVGYCSHTEMVPVVHEGAYVLAENLNLELCLCGQSVFTIHINIMNLLGLIGTHYKIIEGICYGLHYLHEKWQAGTPIIHMDLKPKNILLDDNMVPKIADFGLSRLFGVEQTQACTTSQFGTIGYMAPEYRDKGLITKKLDIFSLGVIIIEIMTGRRDYPDEIETSSQEFIELVLKNWRNRLEKAQRYTSGISPFPSSHREIDYLQIRRCIQIGLACVKHDLAKRPTALKIMNMLHGLEGPEEEVRAGSARRIDPTKRHRDCLLEVDDSEPRSLMLDDMKSKVAKLTEKGGLLNAEAIEKLVHLLQLDQTEEKMDVSDRVKLADVIAATENPVWLDRLVQSRGLLVLNSWVDEAHQKEADKPMQELLLALLRALAILPINLSALQSCSIGKSVNHLRSHRNLEIQKKAKSLVEDWKRRVDTEMKSNL
ncbi:hypothetical protein SETIT_2G143600v2 [Setaria italica]|uniref:non-specific serine/threonine protein kinase n=1 Tax=Setaria italica TaxID=4555 RepID=A0A368PZC1_SETIT|nr:hypothetical protein SETIT_2G143600v2 [Setaria italica]